MIGVRIYAVTLVTTLGAMAQTAVRPPSVRAEGEAVVSARPDRARIDVGVVTEAATAQAAAAQNAGQLKAALEKLRAASGAQTDIRTISYSVSPSYQYPRSGGKPVISGYTAVNTVEVTTDDLTQVGPIIDAATQGGANQIQRLQFMLKDENPVRARALREAVREARSNAEAMAAAMGMKVGPLISLEQGSGENFRPRMGAMAANVAAATPVEPASVEVRASVVLTVAVQ